MSTARADGTITVEVVAAPEPRRTERVALQLAADASVADALQAAGMSGASVGVWGRVCALDQRLRDGDRVEIYRPLRVDPKEARRRRYQRDGLGPAARRAG